MGYKMRRAMIDTMTIKTRLTEARERKNMSLRDLHFESKLDMRTLKRWERGQIKQLDLDKMEALCKALDCEPGDLLVTEE